MNTTQGKNLTMIGTAVIGMKTMGLTVVTVLGVIVMRSTVNGDEHPVNVPETDNIPETDVPVCDIRGTGPTPDVDAERTESHEGTVNEGVTTVAVPINETLDEAYCLRPFISL